MAARAGSDDSRALSLLIPIQRITISSCRTMRSVSPFLGSTLTATDRAWPIADTGSVLSTLEYRAILQRLWNTTVLLSPWQFRLQDALCQRKCTYLLIYWKLRMEKGRLASHTQQLHSISVDHNPNHNHPYISLLSVQGYFSMEKSSAMYSRVITGRPVRRFLNILYFIPLFLIETIAGIHPSKLCPCTGGQRLTLLTAVSL